MFHFAGIPSEPRFGTVMPDGAKASDHDYNPKTTATPYEIFILEQDIAIFVLYKIEITSDFIVDVLKDFGSCEKHRFSQVKTLLINPDNGAQNSSRRTQFMKGIVEFAHKHQVKNICLAYYPPYHSKYNPIRLDMGSTRKSSSLAVF